VSALPKCFNHRSECYRSRQKDIHPFDEQFVMNSFAISVKEGSHEDANNQQRKCYIEQPAFSRGPCQTLCPDSPKRETEQPNENEHYPDNRVHNGGTIVKHAGLLLINRLNHAWIITRTPKGCHLWTEETMKGPLWIELAKKAPDAFWRTHEKLLADLAKVAIEREGSRTTEAAVR
jgi:hypothetical protein